MNGRLNNRGASFLFALAFFLVCCLAGSSLFALARTYGMRMEKKQEREARYLAALSATEFLKDQIEECAAVWETEELSDEAGNKVQEEILKGILHVCQKGRPKSCVLTLDLERGEDVPSKMDRVTVVLTVGPDGPDGESAASPNDDGDGGLAGANPGDATLETASSANAALVNATSANAIPANTTPANATPADAVLDSSTVPIIVKAKYFVNGDANSDGNLDGNPDGNQEEPFLSMIVRGKAYCEMNDGTEVGKKVSAMDIQWEESRIVKGDCD